MESHSGTEIWAKPLILSWPLLYRTKHKGFVRREFCSSSLHAKPTVVNSMPTSPAVSLQAPHELPRCNLKLAPILGGQGETEEREGHPRFVDGRFNEQGSLHTRHVSGARKMSRSLHHPAS